uniref:BTB domain-containing protein n=1 Tax=Panagrolaimus davidi TaxID=227884 RepID=A0A914PXK8_9BILA
MDILQQIQLQLFEAFKSQSPELFDTVFEIEGKKLYAEKLRLSLISSTFNSMLSDRWISKNNAIPIKNYSFNDFKEFLTFLYSEKCQLSDENILTMIDIAEFYQVNSFKKYCGKYLSKITLNMENIFQLIETSHKYSIVQIKKSIQDFFKKNFETFVKCEEFLKADKSVIKNIVTYNILKPEQIFQAIYEWAENQATVKNESEDEIKAELKEFLPYIQFEKMRLPFIKNYFVQKDFLFSDQELHVILDNAMLDVKVTNTNGQSLFCKINVKNNFDTIKIIKSLKNVPSANISSELIYWKTKCKKPSTPCPLKWRAGVKWYLVYFLDGDIGVQSSIEISHHEYLLAEMTAETDFNFTPKCKIEIE